MLGLHCHAGSPPVVASGACSRAVVLGFLTTAALLVAQHRLSGMWARELWRVGTGAEARGHRLSGVCGHRSCGTWAQALGCVRAQELWRVGTGSQACGHRSCGAWAQVLRRAGTGAVACGLSSFGSGALELRFNSGSKACGIFRGQALNLCLLRWQESSLTAEPPGKPIFEMFRDIVVQANLS